MEKLGFDPIARKSRGSRGSESQPGSPSAKGEILDSDEINLEDGVQVPEPTLWTKIANNEVGT